MPLFTLESSLAREGVCSKLCLGVNVLIPKVNSEVGIGTNSDPDVADNDIKSDIGGGVMIPDVNSGGVDEEVMITESAKGVVSIKSGIVVVMKTSNWVEEEMGVVWVEVGGVWTGEGVGSGLKNGVNILIPNVNSDVGIGNSSDIDLSEVKLTVSMEEKNSEEVSMTNEDVGIGIKVVDVETVKDEISRAEEESVSNNEVEGSSIIEDDMEVKREGVGIRVNIEENSIVCVGDNIDDTAPVSEGNVKEDA